MCFHPMCLYSIYSEFPSEFNNGQKWHFSSQPKLIIPALTNGSSQMPSFLVGGTVHLHLKGPGFNSQGWQIPAFWQNGVEQFFPFFLVGSS